MWDLVARSCMHLDAEEYDNYLALLDDALPIHHQLLQPRSEERDGIVAAQQERPGKSAKNIHNHVHLPGKLFRQASLYSVERKPDDRYSAMSYVTVTYTNLDGASAIFCVGRYHDEIAGGEKGLRLMSRRFAMETRDIGTGCHYPI